MALGREGRYEPATQVPHWMRLLEEKYQRLHAKILNQASRFTHRRPSAITTRVLKESRRKRAASSSDQGADGSINAGAIENTDLLLNTKDQERDQSQFDEPGINEAAIDDRCFDTLAQVVDLGNQTYPSKQAITGSAFNGQRPHTQQESTRSKVFCDSITATTTTHGENSYTVTPLSSGLVTRISSAFPKTRLSSAYNFSALSTPRNEEEEDEDVTDPELTAQHNINNYNDDQEEENDSNGNYRPESHAFCLTKALRLELENDHKEEWVDGLRARLSKTTHDDRTWVSTSGGNNEETKSERMSVQCHTERSDLDAMARRRRRHINRPVKTSVSRVSNNTSKSCPASFVQQGTDNGIGGVITSTSSASRSNNLKPLPSSVIPLTAKGVQESRMRVFARMSLEARHAVDETLKEMKMEEETNKIPSSENDINGNAAIINNSNNSSNSKNNDNNKIDDNDDDNDNDYKSENGSNSSLRNNVSTPTGDNLDLNKNHKFSTVRNSTVQDACSVVSMDSDQNNNNNDYYAHLEGNDVFPPKPATFHLQNRSSKISTVSYSTNSGMGINRKPVIGRKLPQINQNPGNNLNPDGFPTPHAPLPSIKRMNLGVREDTFEITPADFDIRFREIITCQKGDRDTPPLDVRQQSIEKCQQWLVQHTPRR